MQVSLPLHHKVHRSPYLNLKVYPLQRAYLRVLLPQKVHLLLPQKVKALQQVQAKAPQLQEVLRVGLRRLPQPPLLLVRLFLLVQANQGLLVNQRLPVKVLQSLKVSLLQQV